MPRLPRSFFARPAEILARDLIGTILVHRLPAGTKRGRRKELRARIVETEAYIGPHDLAAHSSKGRTKRNEVMFGPAGFAYVYFIYGLHEMFNIVAATEGDAQAVLIRAAEAVSGFDHLPGTPVDLSGPAKLAKGFKIPMSYNGIDLTGDTIFLRANPGEAAKVLTTTRIGVDYAGEWAGKLLRFYDADSRAVSKRPKDAPGSG